MPVQEAFRRSSLKLSAIPFEAVGEQSTDIASIITSVTVVVFVILSVAALPDIIRVIPKIIGCYSRKSNCVNMEDNLHSSRNRNFLAFILSLPFCIVADKISLYRPPLLSAVPHGWMTLVLMGIMFAYMLLRTFTAAVVRKPYHIHFEAWRAVRLTFLNYFILMVLVTFVSGGSAYLFKAGTSGIRMTFYCEIAFIYLLSFIRTGQILRDNCSVLGTILYLCALEIIPTGALIAFAIFP